VIGRSVGLGLAFVLLWAVSASAQDYERNGFYVGVGGAYALDNHSDLGPTEDLEHIQILDRGVVSGEILNRSRDLDGGPALNGRVGYRFHPNVSAELAVEWADGLGSSQVFGETWVKIREIDWIVTTTANLKVYLETARVQPFLMLGMGSLVARQLESIEIALSEPYNVGSVRWRGEDTLADFAARFGAGLDIYATEQIVVSLEASYVLPAGEVDDFAYGSLGMGLQYRF
jgi:hypothetical protein